MKKSLSEREKNLHSQFVMCGKNAKDWMRKCVLLLPEIEKHEIWRKKGFVSIYVYAAMLAGMNHEQVNEALRVLSKIADKPELQKIVEQKGLNAVKPVVTIATAETAAFWAEKVQQMSKNTLETYVREFKKENLFDSLPRKESGATTEHIAGVNSQLAESTENQHVPSFKKIIMMELDPDITSQLEKLKGDGDWNDLMKQFLQMREEKFENEKPEIQECEMERESRHIPAKIKNFVIARTNGRCAFPGCSKPYKILHHTQRFALENVHDGDRLHALCKGHERIAHLGLIENEDKAPQFWKLRREAEKDSPKYEIDLIVNKFRVPVWKH